MDDSLPGYGALYTLLGLLHASRGPGANALDPAFHGPLCQYLMATPYPKNLYLLQRGAFKTSVITVARNILRILRNPQIRILIASNKAENANAMLSEIKGHLTNPWLVAAFPDVLYADPARDAEKWTESLITVRRKRRTKEATIETVGVAGELTSKHYDHATFDDVVGRENSQTREMLADTINFIRIAESLLDPGSTADYVGTPWHYADAWAWLLEQKAHHGLELGTYIQPCWVPDPDGEPVPYYGRVRATFPSRFPVPELLRIRAMKGSAEFAAQYLLNPVSPDTTYFPREKITVRSRRELPAHDTLWLVMTVDPAISTKAWADYSAIAVTGFDPAGAMYLLDLRRGKWPESELIAQIYDAYARTPGIRAIGFEAISFAKIFRHLFTAEGQKRGFYLPVMNLERDTKITKNVRIRALQPWWEAGEITIASECPALEDFLEEAERFRTDRENAHDDLLDAVVDALQLRTRPSGPEPDASLYDDPETLERLAFERELIATRASAGRRPLDQTELRVAWSHHQRVSQLEAEAERGGATALAEWAG